MELKNIKNVSDLNLINALHVMYNTYYLPYCDEIDRSYQIEKRKILLKELLDRLEKECYN